MGIPGYQTGYTHWHFSSVSIGLANSPRKWAFVVGSQVEEWFWYQNGLIKVFFPKACLWRRLQLSGSHIESNRWLWKTLPNLTFL